MGLGYKDFTAGAVLTDAEVDGYLMRQTIMEFTNAAARNAALSGVLDEGLHAYTADNDRVTYYDGATWRPVAGKIGCTLVQTGQSYGTGVTATMTYSSETDDTDSFHTSSGTVTIPAGLDGLYSVTTYVTPGATVNGACDVAILVNGAEVMMNYIPATKATIGCSWTGLLLATNTITVRVYNGHSGTLNFAASTRAYWVGGR